MFARFRGSNGGGCSHLTRPGVSANVNLRELTYVSRSISGLFRISAIRGVVGRVVGVTNIGCRSSRGGSVSLHIVASRMEDAAVVVSSNIVPSGRNENCILEHLLHHTTHRNELLNVSEPFLCRITRAIVGRGSATCPDLLRGRSFVVGIVGTRRRGFTGAVSANLGVLRRVIGGASNGIVDNTSTFGLSSACNFPLSLAGSVLSRGNVAISRRRCATLVARTHGGTHRTRGSTNTRT